LLGNNQGILPKKLGEKSKALAASTGVRPRTGKQKGEPRGKEGLGGAVIKSF